MHNLLRQVGLPARAIMVSAAVATAVLAGTAGSALAAPAAAGGTTVRLVSAAQGQEFDGFGEGRSAFIALRAGRNSARQQATAAGFSICTTVFEDSSFDPGFGTFVAESDLFCTG
jgi:hypothetical protein